MTNSNSTNKDVGAIGEFAIGEFVLGNAWVSPLWPNFSLPVRQKIAPALAIALAASGFIAGPLAFTGETSGSFVYAWSEPVREKPGLRSYLQPFHTGEINPSVFSAEPWFAPLSEPVREKIGTKAANQSFLAYVAAQTQNFPLRSGEINFAEETQFSKYSYAWSEPVRVKPGIQVSNQDYLFFEEEPPIEMMAAWYDWLSEPVRQKPGLGSYLQQTWTFDTTPVPTGRYYGWFAPLSEPVRIKPGLQVQNQDYLFFEEEPPIEMMAAWFDWLSEPVRIKPGLKTHLQQAFTGDTIAIPASRGMGWFAPLVDPVKLPIGLKFYLQRDYTIDTDIVPLAAKLIGWFQWLREPVRVLEGLKTHLQQFLAYHPRILPNPDVTAVMAATETNTDEFLGVVNVYNTPAPSTNGPGAAVSVIEVPDGGTDPVSVRES